LTFVKHIPVGFRDACCEKNFVYEVTFLLVFNVYAIWESKHMAWSGGQLVSTTNSVMHIKIVLF